MKIAMKIALKLALKITMKITKWVSTFAPTSWYRRPRRIAAGLVALAAGGLAVGLTGGLALQATNASAQAENVPPRQPPPRNIAETSEPLAGKLFFSREQRERINRSRKGGAVETEEIVVDAIAARPRRSVINGFVKRSDGLSTVWVDGKPLNPSDAAIAGELNPTDVGATSLTKVKLAGKLDAPTQQKAAAHTRAQTHVKRHIIIKPRPQKSIKSTKLTK